LRIFAGPNGSGKSTVINSIKKITKKNGIPIDFGVYINADEIAKQLREDTFSVEPYQVTFDLDHFFISIQNSGLLIDGYTVDYLRNQLELKANYLLLKDKILNERIAQMLATHLRDLLLLAKRKFSIETVFSHPSKIDFMSKAEELGYKVYLYFVATEDPSINIYRVKEVRVKENGHDVPEDKIRSRYKRCLDLLFASSQHVYRAYYFDNSAEGNEFTMFANFKLNKQRQKQWEIKDLSKVPNWFRSYYSAKVVNLKP
jgi:predicted ABC-type ATPase